MVNHSHLIDESNVAGRKLQSAKILGTLEYTVLKLSQKIKLMSLRNTMQLSVISSSYVRGKLSFANVFVVCHERKCNTP